jgi:transposase-like protein
VSCPETLANPLNENSDDEFEECGERERTATPVRAFAVRLHAPGCSLRGTTTILAELGVERSYQAVWKWFYRLADSVPDPPSAQPTRVVVDETAVRINGELSWVYTPIDLDSKLLLGVDLFERRVTDPAAEFLVDCYGYLTALFRVGLSGLL